MGKTILPLYFFFLAGLFFFFSLEHPAGADTLSRDPSWAGIFYPADTEELVNNLEDLDSRVKKPASPLPGKRLRALILPHAGYMYSGLTAAHASLVLRPNQFKKVILIGPDHHLTTIYGRISRYRSYQTPLGDVPLDQDARRLVSRSSLFRKLTLETDQREHSLEVPLPFLQHYLEDFELVPIILGPGDVTQLSRTLTDYIDSGTLLVVSTDLSHYLEYESAVKKDRQTIGHILNLEGDELEPGLNQACGLYPLKLLIQLCRNQNWQPHLIHYSNSGDTAGTRDRVVGYATIALYELTEEKKRRSQYGKQTGIRESDGKAGWGASGPGPADYRREAWPGSIIPGKDGS